MRSLFSIHPEPLTVLVSQDSGVQSFADLEGQRFNIGNPGSGSRASIDLLLNAMGLDTSFFGQATEYRPDEHGQALCDNKIDGLFYGVGHPSTNIQEPTTTCGAQLVPLEGDRKSTRLNSSHVAISYAVFCLTKKKRRLRRTRTSTVV